MLALCAVTRLGGAAPVILRLAGLFPDNGRSGLATILFAFMTVVEIAVITAPILAASIVADVTDQIRIKMGCPSEGAIFRQSHSWERRFRAWGPGVRHDPDARRFSPRRHIGGG
jgi:hypothetical protein